MPRATVRESTLRKSHKYIFPSGSLPIPPRALDVNSCRRSGAAVCPNSLDLATTDAACPGSSTSEQCSGRQDFGRGLRAQPRPHHHLSPFGSVSYMGGAATLGGLSR